MPHGITQCYLPPGRGDIPAVTPAEAGTRVGGATVSRVLRTSVELHQRRYKKHGPR